MTQIITEEHREMTNVLLQFAVNCQDYTASAVDEGI